jgi:hypothetical protein
MAVNIKVKNKFNKEFVNGLLIHPFKEYPFLSDKILRVMQDMYDLGHADGRAEEYLNMQRIKYELDHS